MKADLNFQLGQHRPDDLAQSVKFDLGALHVDPGRRRVTSEGRSWELEPRVMRVLVVLAAASPNVVSRDQLVEACWDGRIVGDDAVNRCILALRNLVRGHTPEPFRIETVRGVGYCLVPEPSAEAVRIPVAPSRRRWGRPVQLGATAALLLAVFAAGLTVWRSLSGDAGDRTWLQLAAVSAIQPDPDVQQLRARFGEALTSAVAAGHVGVTPVAGGHTSAGRRLRLVTSVDHEQAYYVIRARLLDARSGELIWSKRFERTAADMNGFAEITAAHLTDVSLCAHRHARRYHGEMPAPVLTLVLRACSAMRGYDVPELLDASDRLVRAAPEFAGAHALRGGAYIQARLHRVAGDPILNLANAKAEALEALKLDPDYPDAHLVLGTGVGEGLLADERHVRRALAVDPDHPGANTLYVWLLQKTGRLKAATQVAAEAAAKDPFNDEALERLAWLQALEGQFPESRATLRRLELVNPDVAEDVRLRIAFWRGAPADAEPVIRRALQSGADSDPLQCYLDYLAADPAAPLPRTCQRVQSDMRVRLLARSGQLDAAFALADVPPRELGGGLLFLFYPETAALRRDPRFMPLADRLGLVDYWLTSGRWPDFCAEPDLPYDCRAVARRLHGG